MAACGAVLYVGGDEGRVSVLESGDGALVEVDAVGTRSAAESRLAGADCVVSEQSLPDGTGVELCRTVRERHGEVPFVLVPESGSDGLARRAVAAGVNEYLPATTIEDPDAFRQRVVETIDGEGVGGSRYRELADLLADGVALVSGGQIRFANDNLAALLGVPRPDLEGRPIDEFLPGGDQSLVGDGGLLPEQAGERIRDTTELVAADGRLLPVEASATRIRYRGEAGMLLAVRERREGHGGIQPELYETMVNTVPDAVYAVDARGQFIAVNETFVSLTGWREADLIGNHVSLCMADPDIRRGEKLVQELLTGRREKGIYDMDLYTRDGDVIPTETHLALLTGENDEFRGSVGVVRDVTERREYQRRLTVLNRALRHDLRNSMHVILANADLIEDEVADAGLESKLETIRHRAEQVDRLSEKARKIERTLASRAGARRAIDLSDVLADRIEEFRSRYPEASIEAEFPETAWVQATELIDVAVENLVDNSVEHTEDPHIEMSVTLAEETVTVTVTDDGPGIPEVERSVLEQGGEAPLHHANGLGLWLVAWITRDSGGDVVFEEPDGGGSAVHLVLDRDDPVIDPEDPEETIPGRPAE